MLSAHSTDSDEVTVICVFPDLATELERNQVRCSHIVTHLFMAYCYENLDITYWTTYLGPQMQLDVMTITKKRSILNTEVRFDLI